MSSERRVKFNLETAHCGICSERDDKICDAAVYCKTCQKFLCKDCLKPHRKLVAMENHELLNRDHVINDDRVVHFDVDTCISKDDVIISKVPEEIKITFLEYEDYRKRTLEEIEKLKADPGAVLDDKEEDKAVTYEFYEHCDEHSHEKLKYFCNLHQQLCCDVCKADRHSICLSNVKFIPEHLEQIDKTDDVIGKYKDVINDLKDFDKFLQSDIKELKKSRHTFLCDLRTKKRELLNWMNLMEVRAVRRLDIVFDKCKKEIDKKRQNTKKACQKLRTEMYFLKEILNTEQHDKVYKYVKEKKADKVLKEVTAKRENRQFAKSRFHLKVDSEFESAKSSINYLYELSFESKGEDKYSVRLKDDKHVSDITGCTFLDNGDLVLTDRNNCKLKHIDSNFKLIAHSTVPDETFDITAIGYNVIAFTSPRKSRIHIAEVRPSLDIVKSVDTGQGSCWGLSHQDGSFAVSVTFNDKFFIRVVDLESNILFETETKRQFCPAIHSAPESLAISAVAVTAYEEGKDAPVERYIDESEDTERNISVLVYNFLNHLHVRGIALDRHGNVVACCRDTDQVYTVSKAGDEVELLLAESDGLCRPQALCYNADMSKLLVASELTDFVQIFRLES